MTSRIYLGNLRHFQGAFKNTKSKIKQQNICLHGVRLTRTRLITGFLQAPVEDEFFPVVFHFWIGITQGNGVSAIQIIIHVKQVLHASLMGTFDNVHV